MSGVAEKSNRTEAQERLAAIKARHRALVHHGPLLCDRMLGLADHSPFIGLCTVKQEGEGVVVHGSLAPRVAVDDAVAFIRDAPGDMAFLLAMLHRSFREIRALRDAAGNGHGQGNVHGQGNGQAEVRAGSAPAAAPKPDSQKAAKDYAANAAMIVDDERFRAFIAGRMDEPMGNAAYATLQLKRCVGVTSRAELNTNEIAAARWLDLLRDYEAHLRHGHVEGGA